MTYWLADDPRLRGSVSGVRPNGAGGVVGHVDRSDITPAQTPDVAQYAVRICGHMMQAVDRVPGSIVCETSWYQG